MKWLKALLPALLAGLLITAAWLFVRWFDAYEAPGAHWAPAKPIAHELARFRTDMGMAGDYRVRVEKLRSKFPLLFVEYQTPGPVLELTLHSDDGIVRLDQAFADEGDYRITVQCLDHPTHRERIDFTVQTPLAKYCVDLGLFALLFLAGQYSGQRLRALAAACLLMVLAGTGSVPSAWAHGGHGYDAAPAPAGDGALTLSWVAGHAAHGPANRAPLDWRLRVLAEGAPVERAPYSLDVIHLESGLPVLHVEGVSVGGTIPLRYSPPDGTDYRLSLRLIVDGHEHHLAMDAAAEALRPTAGRQWSSFLVLMVPVLAGMGWGWRRGRAGNA